MDAGAAKYLEDNVGGVLAKALAEMAKVQPKDSLLKLNHGQLYACVYRILSWALLLPFIF